MSTACSRFRAQPSAAVRATISIIALLCTFRVAQGEEAKLPEATSNTSTPAAKAELPAVEVVQEAKKSKPANRTASKQRKANPTAAENISTAAKASPIPDAFTPVNGERIGDAAPGTSQSGAGLGGRFTGYTVVGSAVSTKDGIAVMQNPVAVQVVPREVLDDQQAVSVQDAIVGNVSSVLPSSDTFYDGFTIRGFDNANIYRNDLRALSSSHLNTSNLQSIEVLKGPAAMFFGRLEPGGVVNLVLKRPLDTPYTSVEEQVDSWGKSNTSVDTTGALTPDKTWLYRVNLNYSDGDTFRDFVWNRDVFIAPTISFRPNSAFRLNVDVEYQNTTFVADADTALPAIGNRPAPIPVSRYLQDPAVTASDPSTQERTLVGYDWTYNVNSAWSVTNRFSYEHTDYDQRITNLVSLDETTGIANRGLWDEAISREAYATNLDIKGNVRTGPLTHALLFGVDYQNVSQIPNGYAAYADPNYGANPIVGPINIFDPHYSLSGYVKPPNDDHGNFQESWTGVYAQDMVSFFNDRVHLLFGGRYDWADTGYGYSNTSAAEAAASAQFTHEEAFSPRAGIVIQPQPWLSLYANYSKSFGATNFFNSPLPGSSPLAPEEGTQWEGGIKSQFFNNRLTATLAYYDITKSNVAEPIPGNPFYYQTIGLVGSRGFEFDIAGRIDEHWSVIGNYAYDDAKILDDTNGNQGHRLANVPQHAGGIWVKYDADGSFKGLSLGGGVTVLGERQGDNTNDFELPAFARVDAMVMYRLPHYLLDWGKNATLQLNVKNIFDETYYLHSYDRFSIAPGAPRTFIVSLRSEF